MADVGLKETNERESVQPEVTDSLQEPETAPDDVFTGIGDGIASQSVDADAEIGDEQVVSNLEVADVGAADEGAAIDKSAAAAVDAADESTATGVNAVDERDAAKNVAVVPPAIEGQSIGEPPAAAAGESAAADEPSGAAIGVASHASERAKIDFSAIEEDQVIPDKGTAHSFGRKVNIALCAIAFVVLFGYLFIAGEGEDTIRALTSFNWAFLLLALVGIVVYWLLESLSMQIICDSLFRGFSFVKTFIVTVIGQYFNCITPLSSGGQPMQAYYYARFGLPLDKAMPMLLCRFIVYQLTMTVYAIIVLILRFEYFMQDLRAIMYLVAIGFFGGFVLIAMLFSLAFAKNAIMKAVTWAIKLLGRIGIMKHPESTLENAMTSLEESYAGIRFLLKEPKVLVKVSLVTFVQLTVYFSMSWVIFAGFGMEANDYFTVVSCQAFIYLIASFVPLPGAIGASEASYITFFNYVYGDPSVVALSTFIWRAFTFYLPIVLGMILTLMVNNEKTLLARWIRTDDARMAFTDHTVVPKEKKPKKEKSRKRRWKKGAAEEDAASADSELANDGRAEAADQVKEQAAVQLEGGKEEPAPDKVIGVEV